MALHSVERAVNTTKHTRCSWTHAGLAQWRAFRGDNLAQGKMCLKSPQLKSFGSVLRREADGRDLSSETDVTKLGPWLPSSWLPIGLLRFLTHETGICVCVCSHVFVCMCVHMCTCECVNVHVHVCVHAQGGTDWC